MCYSYITRHSFITFPMFPKHHISPPPDDFNDRHLREKRVSSPPSN